MHCVEVEARGRAIVGVNPGGVLRGGWPSFPGGGLPDQSPRLISGPSGIVAHGHAVTVAAENAHTHTVTLTPEASHTHAVDLPPFSIGPDGTHTHTTDTTGSNHTHQIPVNNTSSSSHAARTDARPTG